MEFENNPMTTVEDASKRLIKPEFQDVINRENLHLKTVLKEISEGRLIILGNNKRRSNNFAIGDLVSTKVNFEVGTYKGKDDYDLELEKAAIAEKYGADIITNKSIGDECSDFLKDLLKKVNTPVLSMPILQAAVESRLKTGSCIDLTLDDYFMAVESQIRAGVDGIILFPGVNKFVLRRVKTAERRSGFSSYGASIIMAYMISNNFENPEFEFFDDILELAHKNNVTLIVSPGSKPNTLLDSLDSPTLIESLMLGTLIKKAQAAKVQVSVAGQDYMRIDKIEPHLSNLSELQYHVPKFSKGPHVTNIAPGYTYLSGAMGGAIAARNGVNVLTTNADFDTIYGSSLEEAHKHVIAAKIAAQIGDLSRGIDIAWERESDLVKALKVDDWEEVYANVLDPRKVRLEREYAPPTHTGSCDLCDDECVIQHIRSIIPSNAPTYSK